MLVLGETLSFHGPVQDNVSSKWKRCTSATSCQELDTIMSIKNDGHYFCEPEACRSGGTGGNGDDLDNVGNGVKAGPGGLGAQGEQGGNNAGHDGSPEMSGARASK